MKHGKRVPKPANADAQVTVKLPANLVAALDRFVGHSETRITRPEALEAAFRDWALQHGFLRPEDEKDAGMRPEELNAANDG